MKRALLITAVLSLLSACAPVISQELMNSASLDVPFRDLREDPASHSERLFALGGIIARTRTTDRGSQIEAMYVAVDGRGYLVGRGLSQERFIAFWPRNRGILDPLVYKEGRAITIAGVFVDTQPGRIDDMEYTFPVFRIEDIYLWEEYYREPAYPIYISPYPWYPFWWYPYYWERPWWRHYPPPPRWYGPP